MEETVNNHIEDCLLLAKDLPTNVNQLVAQLRFLRNSCARGVHIQNEIVKHAQFGELLGQLLFATDASELQTMCWQLLANTIVNNGETQQLVWHKYGECVQQFCAATPLGKRTDIQLMIVHNIFHGSKELLNAQHVFQIAIRVWRAIMKEQCQMIFEYLHFLFEQFLVKDGRGTVLLYSTTMIEERLTFLDYLTNYLSQNSPNGLVHDFLLRYISKDFRRKSDCVLCQSDDEGMHLNPREAYALLRVIASASGSEKYAIVYADDYSLFLNVSALLRCLVAAGKKASPNAFTPLNKLEEVAPASNIHHDFEKDVTFELKTLLVRATANLLYNNPTNQNYCHDTQLMPVLFECTNMDARNPLMKEWSIMAIRNACIGCVDNQNAIKNLTHQGSASNDILADLNLQMGSLRIQPNVE